MPAARDRRYITTGSLQFREASDGITVEGYASTFGQPYDMGWYSERVQEGAFTKTLSEAPDVRFLVNHDGLPLARTVSGTLELSQDSTGLHTRSVMDASDPDVQRLVPKIRRGDLDQMSFAFRTIRDLWTDDYSERSLIELSLAGGDVSVVTYPANPGTSVGVRSLGRLLGEDPERIRELYRQVAEERAGKKISAATAGSLQSALEQLKAIDLAASTIDQAGDEAIRHLGGLLEDADAGSSSTDDDERSAPVELEREERAAGVHPSLLRLRAAIAQLS